MIICVIGKCAHEIFFTGMILNVNPFFFLSKLVLTGVMYCVCCCLALGFIRRPLSIVAAALTAVTLAFLNDRFVFLYKRI